MTLGELSELIKQYIASDFELKRAYENRRKAKDTITKAFKITNMNYFITDDKNLVLIDRNSNIIVESQFRGELE